MTTVFITITNPYDDAVIEHELELDINTTTTYSELCEMFAYKDHGYDEWAEFHAEIAGDCYEWTSHHQLPFNLEGGK